MRAYRGADRRHPVAMATNRRLHRRVRSFSVLALLGVLVLAVAAPRLRATEFQQFMASLRAVGATLFMAAGFLRLARWRLTGEARVACSAIALVTLGSALCLVGILGPLLRHDPGVATSIPLARLLFVLPVLGVLAIGLRTAPVRAGLRPGRTIAVLLAGMIALSALVSAPGMLWFTLGSGSPVWFGVECSAALAWLALAWGHFRGGRAEARRVGRLTTRWVAWGMTLMAASELLRAISLGHPGAVAVLGSGTQAIAAGLAVSAAACDLWEAFFSYGSRTVRLTGELDETQRVLADTEQRERERIHDARTAVVGVLGASRLLSSNPNRRTEHGRLHELMTAELTRLSTVLDPVAREEIAPFALAVLQPVLEAQRLAGLDVHWDLGEHVVLGRRLATATVLANLLTNVGRHAPAASVSVTGRLAESCVRIEVCDDGPGIAVGDFDRILDRGARGAASTSSGVPGSGLGLFTAARAMAEQGGCLSLHPSPSGGLLVRLDLPSAEQRRRFSPTTVLPGETVAVSALRAG
ncbi:HAMP domain-containing histidine kinase [Jatrophihabitans telluris]|uniref:histidine kinase n=1 Tax=Jatrophihabitans telluris TaxID=2038343 RepID=A0ABY4QY64_9ACTN|nr:HAMP domain-containing sensor histidine kinase [Jatrophihabitans telluris]UQX88092.1 HAMP domain-containing histidine kinase [Jatrophihabitans telluris]